MSTIAAVKERPILFSGPMVRAILEGRKTQTRRRLKERWQLLPFEQPAYVRDALEICPYGVPGDRLWVREAFLHTKAEYEYSISCSVPYLEAHTVYAADCPDGVKGAGFKPSIHMPRKLSRITLEITEVRVERLQDISEEDAKAEGAELFDGRPVHHYGWRHDPNLGTVWSTPVKSFCHLWDSINAKAHPWASNPWVWAVSFRRLHA